MTTRGLVLIAAALGLAAGTPASAQVAPSLVAQAATSTPAAPASKPAPPHKPAPMPPPIVFFLAKGDANACGVGCSEWIAADGTIDSGADERLRALLKKLGGRKLPIFFHSPGGVVPTGLAIGRLLRQRGLTAGVGWTVPAGCDPKQQNEPACDKLKRSGRDLVAVLDPSHTMCNSACVYALVGAAVREIGAGVGLGVHSSSISFTLKRIDGDGHVTRTSTHVAPTVERKALESAYGRISAYLREMGISQDLLTAARGVEFSQLRVLTRDQLVAFGIDRREVVEGMWWFADQSSGPSAVKIIEETRDGTFRKDILRLSCSNAFTLRLQYVRDLDPHVWSWPAPLRVTAGGRSFSLSSPFTALLSGSHGPMEVRSVDLPMSVLGDAAFTIESAAAATPAVPAPGVPAGPAVQAGKGVSVGLTGVAPQTSAASISKLTVQSAGPGLSELSRRCGGPPANSPPAPAEHI
jgi:hypothetical protein